MRPWNAGNATTAEVALEEEFDRVEKLAETAEIDATAAIRKLCA